MQIKLTFPGQRIGVREMEPVAEECYKRSKDFFDKHLDSVEIIVLFRRSQMDRFVGFKTPEWLVGAEKGGKIAIFSPSVFEKVSNHKKSEFVFVLTHEITHLFLRKLFVFKQPTWLIEGVAGIVPKQRSINPQMKSKLISFERMHTDRLWMKNHNYHQVFTFVAYLIKTFGKKKLLSLMGELEELNSYNSFLHTFNTIYGQSFEEIEKGWRDKLP